VFDRVVPEYRGCTTVGPVPHSRAAVIAQLGERKTEDLKVSGSIPDCGTYIILQRNERSNGHVYTSVQHGLIVAC
jgi:hypothetical protein